MNALQESKAHPAIVYLATSKYPGEKPSDDEFKEMLSNNPIQLQGCLEIVAGIHSSKALEMYVDKKVQENALHTVNEPFRSYKIATRVFFEHKVTEQQMCEWAEMDNFKERALHWKK